jgi:hypothetical protein
MEFPKMLYKVGGPEEIHGGRFSTLIVDGAESQDAALADGWYLTTDSAKSALETPAPAAVVDASPSDDAPVTRAELEQKASEIGLKFDGRTGDKKLAAMIDEHLKA